MEKLTAKEFVAKLNNVSFWFLQDLEEQLTWEDHPMFQPLYSKEEKREILELAWDRYENDIISTYYYFKK